MNKKIKDMLFEKGQVITEARAITDKAEKEKRTPTPEENQKVDELLKRSDEIQASVEREMKLQEQETSMQQSINPVRNPDTGSEDVKKKQSEERRKVFGSYIRSGRFMGDPQIVASLQSDSDTSGGFLAAPQEFVADLLKAVDNAVVIRQLATVYPLAKAESLGIPTLDTDVADADWTSELATGSEDTAMAFGKRELRPHPIAKRIKVSNKLLRNATIDAEALVRGRLAYKFGVSAEKAYMTGDGNQKPLGLFTASSNGLSTNVDKATTSTSGFGSADDLMDIKDQLKPQYYPTARWLFHRNAVTKIRKLKTTGSGDYIWQPSLAAGIPDRILDIPYVMSEYVPNTFTTGLYIGLLGDFSFYWIADALDLGVQRLNELYAENNQVGFIGRLETDGMPMLEEPFVRIKCQ